MKLFRMFLQTAVLGTGAYLVLYRDISPGAMIAASILITRALQPIELAVGNWRGFLAARSAFERVKNLFTVGRVLSRSVCLCRGPWEHCRT